jgi:hypothetical protein
MLAWSNTNASLIRDSLHLRFHDWQSSCLTVRFVCLLFCFPPARPDGGSPLGHGWSRDGHGGAPRSRSRPVTSPRVGSRQSRSWASSPSLCRSPRQSRFLSDARLRDRSRVRSVRHVSPSPLEQPFAVPTGPDFDRVAGHVPVATLITCSRDPEVASSIQNVPRPTRSAAGQ